MFGGQSPAPATGGAPPTDERRDALLALLSTLEAEDYRFVTPTPATHARVIARPGRDGARGLRDVLGWSLPVAPELLPPPFLELLRAGNAVQALPDGRLKATVRVSTVHDTLFLHSAYPTTAKDAVFLGPDTYRFADLIAARMGPLAPGARILDYGAGAGVGGIVAAGAQPGARLVLADVNPHALFLAGINAEHAGVDTVGRSAASPEELDGPFDLIVANPPYMMDRDGRAYRDGGDLHGARLSLDWAEASLPLLAPGGKLILYTGVAIVDGRDPLREPLTQALGDGDWTLDYRELDPDVFGEELDSPAYADVERIAVVGAVGTRR